MSEQKPQKSASSQALHGPYLVSYGDVQEYLLKCKRRINLTPNEHEVLTVLVHAMRRPGYRTIMSDVVRMEAKEWQEITLIHRQHIHAAFKGLIKKNIVRSIKASGESTHYFLSPDFITAIVRNQFVFVDNVDNARHCNESCDSTVTNLVTECNESCDSTVTNLVTECNESCDSPSYIETPLVSNLPSTRSSNPAVDNVDNSQDQTIDELVAKTLEIVSLGDWTLRERDKLIKSAQAHAKGNRIEYGNFLTYCSNGPNFRTFGQWNVAWARYLIQGEAKSSPSLARAS